MDLHGNSEDILASFLNQDPSEVSKIPEELRLVLIGMDVFFNCKFILCTLSLLQKNFNR